MAETGNISENTLRKKLVLCNFPWNVRNLFFMQTMENQSRSLPGEINNLIYGIKFPKFKLKILTGECPQLKTLNHWQICIFFL